MKEKLSYVVPCYGSEETIESVVEEIISLMKGLDQYDYEVILVNDCSPDKVWLKIGLLCEKYPFVKGINLAKNFGQHSALMAGYNICTGDYVVTLDDDGQTPVDQVGILLDKLKEGYDVVYAKYEERQDNSFRKIGTMMNNFMLTSLLGKPKNIHLTSFFISRGYVIKEICSYRNAFPYIWGLVLRTTKNITNATIKHNKRLEGESGYTFSKLLSLWMNGFTAFSIKPLRVAAILGITFTGIGVIGIIFTVVNKLLHPEIMAGYSSLMTVMLFIGGVLMLSLGLIGEYIGRIYLCINTMPQFVIRETKNLDEDEREK